MVVRETGVLKRDLTLAQEYLGFLLLNLFDLFLTGYIFRHSGQEANGVASWVLIHFKLRGFALFKFIMVVVIILICEMISMKSVKTAKALIVGACMLYVTVVIYECFLIWLYIDRPPARHAMDHSVMTALAFIPIAWPSAVRRLQGITKISRIGWIRRG